MMARSKIVLSKTLIIIECRQQQKCNVNKMYNTPAERIDKITFLLGKGLCWERVDTLQCNIRQSFAGPNKSNNLKDAACSIYLDIFAT